MSIFQQLYANERSAAEVARTAPRRRRLAALAAHAAAEAELSRLWHELSRGLHPGPIPVIDEEGAFQIDVPTEDKLACVESLRRITGRTGRNH